MRTQTEKEQLKDKIDAEIQQLADSLEGDNSLVNKMAEHLISRNCIIVAVGFMEALGSTDYRALTADYAITDATQD